MAKNIKTLTGVDIYVHEAGGSFRPLLEEYARKFECDIILHDSHNSVITPKVDGIIHIYPWCTSIWASERKNLSSVFGIPTREAQRDCKDCSLEELKRNEIIPLVDPKGILYGEIPIGAINNLYIHFDITHCWNEDTEKIMRHILDGYFQILTERGKLEDLQMISEDRRKSAANESENRYIDLCMSRIPQEIHDLRMGMERNENFVDDLKDSLTHSQQRLREIKKELKAMEQGKKKIPVSRKAEFLRGIKFHETRINNIKKDIKAKEVDYKAAEQKIMKISAGKNEYSREIFKREYQNLLNSVFVEGVVARESSIEVHTTLLILNKRGIGHFSIRIDLNEEIFHVNNLDSALRSGRHHPHCSGGTNYCLGGTREIRRLIQNKHFLVAFHKIWNQLNKYEPGKDLRSWPLVKEARRKK